MMKNYYYRRLFQNISFGKATLDLVEKAGFRLLFLKPIPKLTEFWNWLIEELKLLTMENENLINEYLDIAVNAPEDMKRFVNLLTDDCVWALMPPGISINGKESVEKFVAFAMRSRKHNNNAKVEIRNWFSDGNKFCVEYFHAALITIFKIKVMENVCLVCEMKNGKFNKINEYIDTSGSKLISLGLKILPIIAKIRKINTTNTCKK